jgi:hypothetical protein
LGWIIEQLTMAAIAKGQVYTAERLRINAEDLIDIPQQALAAAFVRARKELDFVPGVSELRRLAGEDGKVNIDAEARAAWEMLEVFVRRYVDCDPFGSYGPEHGWYPKTYPLLSGRITDTVNRSGGWRAYKTMTDEQFPFQQRRFYDEYKAWVTVEQVAPHKLLTERPRLQLVAKPLDIPKTEMQPKPVCQQVTVKKISEPVTEAQIHDRREMLRQQAESWAKRSR